MEQNRHGREQARTPIPRSPFLEIWGPIPKLGPGRWVPEASRDRNSIYGYLTAVYGLVAWWTAEGREVDRARRALRLHRLGVSEREDAFAAIIRRTADPAKADKRTRSKWSRVMRCAAA